MKKYSLDDNLYSRYCDLIQSRLGIRAVDSRREALFHSLKEMADNRKLANLEELLLSLQEAATDSALWDELIKEVTVGETYFFRDSAYIEALRQHILPNLVARHKNDRTLRIWSAGCATGEEPYTLAILLRQILFDIDQWNIFILATDINRHSLEKAMTGHYRAWSFRESDTTLRHAFFTHDNGIFMLHMDVRKMVTFAYQNLSADDYPSPNNFTNNMDLILCRNVSIYLPSTLIQEIAHRFHRSLSNEGWLIVGPSETHLEIYSQFQTINFPGATAYQKVPDLPSPAFAESPLPSTRSRQEIPVVPLPYPQSFSSLSLSDYLSLTTPQPSASREKPPVAAFEVPLSESRPIPPVKNKALINDPKTDLCQRGEELMKQRRYDEARECFLSYLTTESDAIPALYWLACLEANAGRLDEARKWAQQALDQDPLRSEVHYKLALVHQVQGNSQEAISRLKKVIYLDPNFVLAHFGLYHLYHQAGHSAEAERHRVLAIHLASKLPSDMILPGSDDLTAGQLLTIAQTVLHKHSSKQALQSRGKS